MKNETRIKKLINFVTNDKDFNMLFKEYKISEKDKEELIKNEAISFIYDFNYKLKKKYIDISWVILPGDDCIIDLDELYHLYKDCLEEDYAA
jgi:hypothetical protein